VIPISYTSLSKWESCPRHWRVVYKQKIKDTGNKATFAGSADHAALELAVKGQGPAPCHFSQQIVDAMRASPGRLESEKWLTINRDLTYAPYGVTPYIRVSVDVLWTSPKADSIAISDWKTGSWAPANESQVDFTQLRLYALAAMAIKKDAMVATTNMIYTQKRKVFSLKVWRSEISAASRSAEFKDLFARMAKHEAAQDDENPKAIPGRMCSFCPDALCVHHPGHAG
jgi:hypothetical protein